MTADASALIVSYMWPPAGGVGSQRVLKLAKYLPEHGYTPTVLTVANPSVPLLDESLMGELPAGISVLRARTLEPEYATKALHWKGAGTAEQPGAWLAKTKRGLSTVARQVLIPDPQVLWQPDAQRVLLGRLLQRRESVVCVTAPPFSAFLSAPLVRLVGRVGLVLDYRDEWLTLRTQYEMLSRLGSVAGHAMEYGVLRCADAITVATDAFREHLLERFGFLDPGRVVTITNGYDPDDYAEHLLDRTSPPSDRFVLAYAGTIFRQNSPKGLIGALRRLHAREPQLARLLRVRFIGRIVETERKLFEGTEALGVERVGFIDRDQVMPALAAAHMTMCLLDTMPGAERIYPAKVFELMRLGRPCLTIAPEGALTALARKHELGPVVSPRDENAIADMLASALRQWQAGAFPARAAAIGIERYHRCAIAGQFADVFRSATKRSRRLQ